MSKDSVVIIDGARTPMGGLQGSVSSVAATELATTAITATGSQRQKNVPSPSERPLL